MPRGDGTGPQGSGQGRGQRRGRKTEFDLYSPLQKSSIGATIFAFASILMRGWLDKKLSKKNSADKPEQNEPSEKKI